MDDTLGISEACIYCGSSSDLTDEHLIPYGAGGNFLYRNASCKNCAKTTSEIEREVLREVLLFARSYLGIQSRRKKFYPKTIEVEVLFGRYGPRKKVTIPIELYPVNFIHPIYLPEQLDGQDFLSRVALANVQVEENNIADIKINHLLRKFGAIEVQYHSRFPLLSGSFERMIWKIAYGFLKISSIQFRDSEISDLIFKRRECIEPGLGTYFVRNLTSRVRSSSDPTTVAVRVLQDREDSSYINCEIMFSERLRLPVYVARTKVDSLHSIPERLYVGRK